MRVVSLSATALALGLLATPASAQLHGFAVDYAPVATGVTIKGSVNKGLNDESGKFTSAGGMVVLGLPSIQIGAGAGVFDLSDGKTITFGGHAMFNLPLPPATPVSIGIVAGAGFISEDFGTGTATVSVSSITVPVGAVLSLDVPSPSLDVTPWISPTFRYTRVGEIVAGTGSSSASNFGVSGGVTVGLPAGIGFFALADYVDKAITIAGGAQFALSVPGIGGMGM